MLENEMVRHGKNDMVFSGNKTIYIMAYLLNVFQNFFTTYEKYISTMVFSRQTTSLSSHSFSEECFLK